MDEKQKEFPHHFFIYCSIFIIACFFFLMLGYCRGYNAGEHKANNQPITEQSGQAIAGLNATITKQSEIIDALTIEIDGLRKTNATAAIELAKVLATIADYRATIKDITNSLQKTSTAIRDSYTAAIRIGANYNTAQAIIGELRKNNQEIRKAINSR